MVFPDEPARRHPLFERSSLFEGAEGPGLMFGWYPLAELAALELYPQFLRERLPAIPPRDRASGDVDRSLRANLMTSGRMQVIACTILPGVVALDW